MMSSGSLLKQKKKNKKKLSVLPSLKILLIIIKYQINLFMDTGYLFINVRWNQINANGHRFADRRLAPRKDFSINFLSVITRSSI